MPVPVLVIGGVVIWMMALHAVVSGRVMAGSRGLKANYYYRKDQPLLYYSFLSVYLLVGFVVLFHTF